MVPTPLVLKKKSIKKQKTSDTLIGTDSTNNYLLPGPSSVGRVKKRRKIRATEDFNQWNRSSLGSDIKPAIRESLLVQGKKTKKLKEYNYLPKILIDDLQNVSPNSDYARKKSKCKQVKSISTESSVEASSEITSEDEKSNKQKIQKKKRSTRKKLSDVVSDPDECIKVKTVSTESSVEVSSEITSEERKSDKLMIQKKKKSKGKKLSDGISDPDDPEVVFNVHKRRKRRRGPNHNQAHPVTYSEDDLSKSCSSSPNADDANKNLQNSCNSETQDILKQQNISTLSECLLKQNQTFEEREVAEESQGKRLTRKSVRFVTPEEKTKKKRNTFDLESPTTDALKSLSKHNSSTFEKLEDRRCTPHVKKSVEIDARQNISKLKLEYSTDSASEDIDLYAIEPVDNNVTVSKHGNTSNISDETTQTSNKTTRTRKTRSKDNEQITNETQDSVKHRQATTYKKENAEQNNILHNISLGRASDKASVSNDASTVDKNERKLPSLVHRNSKNNIQKHTSLTPNKFEAKNNSLRRNILHKSTLGLLDKTDGRNSRIISTPNKSTPHNKMVDSPLRGSPLKLAATDKKCTNLKRVYGSAITLDQTNEKYISHISLNDSEKNLLGIALNNSSKNTLRRSNSAPNIQDLNNKSLPSPIVKKSKTPKKTTNSSVINLITPTSAETNQTGNKSTRKRWNKSMGVSFLDSSGNVFNISPPWKVDLSDAVQSESDTSVLLEKKQSSVKKIKEPSGSSTPYASVQKNKKIIVERSPLKTSDRLSLSLKKSGASISKPSTRKKMPNFALIHQMAFDKMENIQEMAERKATRAQQLISGQKPAVTVTKQSPNCRKPLKYSPKIVKKVIPVIKRTKKSPTVQINIKTNLKVITPSKSNPKVISKPVQRKLEQAKLKSAIPKPLPKKVEDEKKQLSKLGFKVQSQLPKSKRRDQEVQAVAARTSILKNTVDTRRNIVQNIRTNRRFELLMKMRNKQ